LKKKPEALLQKKKSSFPPPPKKMAAHHPSAFSLDRFTGHLAYPLIVVSDHAGLVEVLRLCDPGRFDEAYAFLAPDAAVSERT